MRERLDCVILGCADMAGWCKCEEGIYAKGRLYLHRLDLPDPSDQNVDVLVKMVSHLQRFDVCLIAVSASNLAWVRQAMLLARPQLRTPVIGMVHHLKAPAIDDLYNLGMADFVCEPLCIEEIRIRTERVLDHPRPVRVVGYADQATAGFYTVNDGNKGYGDDNRCLGPDTFNQGEPADVGGTASSVVARQAGEIALESFAAASASQCAMSSESFGAAKGRVVQCFERAYIHASLAKSSGNIALAARGAKKHRRAFWALMRKHEIDAAPYRKVMPSDP